MAVPPESVGSDGAASEEGTGKALLFLSDVCCHAVDRMTAHWKRRGTSLLQIGAVPFFPPDRLWEAGFDVTFLDDSWGGSVSAVSSPMVEAVKGRAEHMPFEDGEFDYAVVMFRGISSSRRGMDILGEALRVAAAGVLVLDASIFAPSWMRRVQAGMKHPVRRVSPWGFRSAACSLKGSRRAEIRSAMLLPFSAGMGDGIAARVLGRVNRHLSHIPAGALLAMRMDWQEIPLSPAGLIHTVGTFCRSVSTAGEAAGCARRRESLP